MTKIAGTGSRIRIRIQDPNPDPNPLFRGMETRIRIHPKMTWIRNTGYKTVTLLSYEYKRLCFSGSPPGTVYWMWRRMMCGTAAIVSSVSIKGKRWVLSSVVDPDPYVLGHPDLDSGSVIILYASGSGYGSGSFHQQAKKARKVLIPTIL
jgi:hypothetical protein